MSNWTSHKRKFKYWSWTCYIHFLGNRTAVMLLQTHSCRQTVLIMFRNSFPSALKNSRYIILRLNEENNRSEQTAASYALTETKNILNLIETIMNVLPVSCFNLLIRKYTIVLIYSLILNCVVHNKREKNETLSIGKIDSLWAGAEILIMKFKSIEFKRLSTSWIQKLHLKVLFGCSLFIHNPQIRSRKKRIIIKSVTKQHMNLTVPLRCCQIRVSSNIPTDKICVCAF